VERVLQATPATISNSWYEDGVIADPGVVTVTITRGDGTVLVTNGATTGTGAAARSYNLTAAAHTDLLDDLTITWVSPSKGTMTSHVEVVGGFLFTITEARSELGDPAYDATAIREAREYAETELESALGYALVPRYARTRTSGQGRGPLRLRPYLRTVRTVTVSDTTLTPTDIANLAFDTTGFLYGQYWEQGVGNITIGYEHGLDAPPPGAKRAALSLAMDYLGASTSGGIDPRAESIVTVDGTVRLRAGGGQFWAPGVNEWVTANRIPAIA
jgi:hypothetical protein